MKPSKKILFLIEQAGTLLQMPRSHVRTLGNAFDTIASHSHHVSIMAYCIARMEGLSHEDGMKALAMGSFHDLAEGRMADLDFISKNYTKDKEEEAIKDQFNGLEFGEDLEKLLGEYHKRKSPIAKCAKDADQLAQMYHEWVLMWRGNKLAQQWFEGDFSARLPYFHTESGKQLALELKESNPNEWWWDEFVTKAGQPKNRKHLVGKNYAGTKKNKKSRPVHSNQNRK
jgi:5'-deoxynucleotidase YfbR-like HD superfamily hydrolase